MPLPHALSQSRSRSLSLSLSPSLSLSLSVLGCRVPCRVYRLGCVCSSPASHMYMQCWHTAVPIFTVFLCLPLAWMSSGFGPSRSLNAIKGVGPFWIRPGNCKAMPCYEKELIVIKSHGRLFPCIGEQSRSDWFAWPTQTRVQIMNDNAVHAITCWPRRLQHRLRCLPCKGSFACFGRSGALTLG